MASYYRVATGSEPASYTWSFSGGTFSGASGGIISFDGVDTSSPIDVEGGNTTPNGFTHTANSITTTVADTMLVSSHEFPSATNGWTPPAGMTEAVDVASIPRPDTVGIALSMNYVTQAAIGATGNKSATADSTGTDAGDGTAHLVALAPDLTPTPVAEWRMDESSWTGAAGEVTDETGNFNATALNNAQTASASPAIAGNPGTCGYGDFPFNTSTTPPDAVDTGVNIDTDVGNDGTITLWYKSNVNWSGGGERTIFDAANASAAGGPKYFFLTLLNNGQLRYGFEDSSDGDFRINTPAQPNSAGTWVHIAVTWDLPNDSLAIFVNGSQVASGTPNTNGVLGQLNTLYIGDNNGEYIISGDTTPNSANGSIDEFRIYDSVLTASQITTIMNETHACAVPPVANTIYLSTTANATLGGLSFQDGDLVEYDAATDTTTSPPFFDESANPPGVPNMDIDAAHLIDDQTLVFSPAQNETIDGFSYEDGDLILYDYATDTFSEFFSENFFSGGADINALYIISHNASQSVFLISVDNTETIGGNSFTDGDIFQVDYDRTGPSITTSIVLDESIYGTDVDVDAVHLLDNGNYVISFDADETINSVNYEDGDLVEYDPGSGTFTEFLSEDLFSGNEDIDAVTQLPSTPVIDHYDIDISPAVGITCLPVTVTITAKDSSNNTIAHTAATTINLATSTGLGTWGAASVGTPTNVVAGAGTADYQFANGQSTVDIQFNYPVLAGAAPESVNINITSTPNETTGVAIPAEDDPSVDFSTAALIFNNVTDGNNIIPTQISGKDSDTGPGAVTLNIQAVRASDNDP
ncbi:MAG: LamG domain-containing protein, partial [Gammaproteobacteria bacterium]|nr:LamG domain-containing protein [Gammaproteobacteria bacterium]